MKNVVLACLVLAVGAAAQQQPQQQETVLQETQLATRVLPADVLRDFPDLCFGSTTFKFYTPETTWNLELFCGQSTCMQNETGIFEKVEDCGPAPKPNDQCIPEFAAPGTPYPACCPKYRCLPGSKLEYPTPEEIKAEAEKARKAQAAAREQEAAAGAAAGQPAAQA